MRQTPLRVWLTAIITAVALLFASAASAQVVEPKENPTDEDIEQAKRSMAAGVGFMQDPDGARYEEAYPEFKEAYKRSGSLNALHNLAICAMKLELDGEAITYYRTVLEKKGDDLEETEKTQIQRDLTRLEETVSWVTLSSDKPGVTVVDVRTPRSGAVIRNKYVVGLTPIKLGIHPGSHVFTARTSDGEEKKWTIEIANGSAHNHEFTFDAGGPMVADGMDPSEITGDMSGGGDDAGDEGAEEGGGIPTMVWVAGGVTLAAGITFAALAGTASSKKSDYDSNLAGVASIEEQQSAIDEINTFNLVADVMLGVTIAGAATTVILALVLPSGGEGEDEAAHADGGPRFGVDYTIAPTVDARGGGGAVLTTRF